MQHRPPPSSHTMATATARIFMLLSAPFPRPSSSSFILRFASRHSRLLLPHTSYSSLSTSSRPHLPPPSSLKSSQHFSTRSHTPRDDQFLDSTPHSTPSVTPHPWPEWLKFVDRLRDAGYFNSAFDFASNELLDVGALSHDFVRDVNACMSFAQHNANTLWSLSRMDIEVVVENGSPFLFKNGADSSRRMKSFLSNVFESEKATTIDLMRFLLSYASMITVSPEKNNAQRRDIVESSIRSLFLELSLINIAPQESFSSGHVQSPFPGRDGQTRPFGRNIEMKRGDWICQRCSFMNFARNLKCLECEEPRPKKQLTGNEWECPQCDFFNFGRNTVCLRCDCKRPASALLQSNPVGGGGYSNVFKYSNDGANHKISAKDEQNVQGGWFNKISQLENSSEMNSTSADTDFPEIMPIRKGVNRFVVSTRKTPLERRLADEQYRRNLENNESINVEISEKLGEMLGQRSTSVDIVDDGSSLPPKLRDESQSRSSSVAFQNRGPNIVNSDAAQFPEQTINDKPQCLMTEEKNAQVYEGAASQTEDGGREQAEKSDRWFKRVAELHDAKDLSSVISEEDFPEVMPMPKGENRFIVSRKKDRSFTSPLYKRRMEMEQQAGNKDYVPFVPFPPDYFANKDKQQTGATESANMSTIETSSVLAASDQAGLPSRVHGVPSGKKQETWQTSRDAGGSVDENKMRSSFPGATDHVKQTQPYRRAQSGDINANGKTMETNLSAGAPQPHENPSIKDSWKGRSLEGSLVKEPDPLDMSEEAKAERWFRRVAQIKDISELSQIPDEDFPSIMPMRKGVNRFVVSKRKTPLERRLTSSQYRRNLPVVNSDPAKKENETS